VCGSVSENRGTLSGVHPIVEMPPKARQQPNKVGKLKKVKRIDGRAAGTGENGPTALPVEAKGKLPEAVLSGGGTPPLKQAKVDASTPLLCKKTGNENDVGSPSMVDITPGGYSVLSATTTSVLPLSLKSRWLHSGTVATTPPNKCARGQGAQKGVTQSKTPGGDMASKPTTSAQQRCLMEHEKWAMYAHLLSMMQVEFLQRCCRVLKELTTSTALAFLHVASLGKTAGDTEEEVSSRGAAAAAESFTDEQEQVYQTVRSTIAASSILGHRSCQVLWGPRGSGKHRILRLVSQENAKLSGTFVMQLHGALLADDEAAIGVIAEQMLQFLKSPTSAAVRASNWLLRTGTFSFGQLFQFEKKMAVDVGGGVSGGAVGDRGGPSRASGSTRASKSTAPPAAMEEEAGEDTRGEIFLTSTTTYLTGGASSALPHLQRALLLLKSNGCSLVLCIRDIDIFGIRCDQLLYVLSGLMHDGDEAGNCGGGEEDERCSVGHHGRDNNNNTGGAAAALPPAARGGMSLVLASSAPDIRHLEKRLSSRLTCEMRYVPLLPWTPRSILRATLNALAEDTHHQLRIIESQLERDTAKRLVDATESLLQRGCTEDGLTMHAKEVCQQTTQLTKLQETLKRKEVELRDLRHQCRHLVGYLEAHQVVLPTARASRREDHQIGCASPINVATMPAALRRAAECLQAQPLLFLETIHVLCEELLEQLDVASQQSDASPVVSHRTCAEHIAELMIEWAIHGSTAGPTLTVVVSLLCKMSSGRVQLFSMNSQRTLLQWLHQRLVRGAEWAGDGDLCHITQPPAAVLHAWLNVARTLTDDSDCRGRVSEPAPPPSNSTSTAPTASLPPQLHDLLADGQLVNLGYGSREVFLLLFYMHLHYCNGIRQRSIPDLLEDVSSSLGTRAAAALDRGAFRLAIQQLCRWRLLRIADGSVQAVEICGSDARLRSFLSTVLSRAQDWCANELGLDVREIVRLRNLF